MRFPARLEFHEVSPDRWPDFERLFEARGGPKHCWCSVFRGVVPKERPTPALKKALIRGRVERAEPVGILGYLDGTPVAWCSVAPKSTFARLGPIDGDATRPDALWSITCFFVPREYRGLGVTSRLIKAAVAHAKAHGARTVEAYPVDPRRRRIGSWGLSRPSSVHGSGRLDAWGLDVTSTAAGWAHSRKVTGHETGGAVGLRLFNRLVAGEGFEPPTFGL